MQPIVVRKSDLKTKLAANLGKHQAEFQSALAGFYKVLSQKLTEKLSDIEMGKDVAAQVSMPAIKPVSHAEDYERALQMLDWEIREDIMLDEDEFKNLVEDKWQWRESFSSSSSSYSPSSSSRSSR